MSVDLHPKIEKYGKLGCIDSGPVAGADDYTTLVIIHGYGWHSGQFQRLLPFTAKAGVRLVLVQRRDFPGSDPLTDGERAQLVGTEHLEQYMQGRARDVHDFLTAFVAKNSIPKKQQDSGRGGIIFCTWSFGGTWLTAFMSNAPSFKGGEVDLSEYIQQAVLYGKSLPTPSQSAMTDQTVDSPNHALGIPFPSETYHPLTDETIPPQDRPLAFAKWVSGYFTHGTTEATLERRTPASDRPPTILTFSQDEIEAFFAPGPAGPDGSDHAILHPGFSSGLNQNMFERTLFGLEDEEWAKIPLRYVWCDRSPYEMPWGTQYLKKYLEEKRASGEKMRDVSITCLEGANHFAHWDEPERLFKALIARK